MTRESGANKLTIDIPMQDEAEEQSVPEEDQTISENNKEESQSIQTNLCEHKNESKADNSHCSSS